MNRKQIVLGAALCVTPFTTADAGTIYGCIEFYDNGRSWPAAHQRAVLQPISGAGQFEIYAGPDGCFNIPNVSDGRYQLVIEHSRDTLHAPVTLFGQGRQEVPLIRLRL